jgi:hypothetical protein
MWAEIVAFDLPDPDVTSITESVNERNGDFTPTIGQGLGYDDGAGIYQKDKAMATCGLRLAAALILLTPCVGQQVVFKFNNDPRLISDVLKRAHISGSLLYSSTCKSGGERTPVPHVGAHRDSGSAREILRDMLAGDSKMQVTQDSAGMVRMVETDVPTDILNVKIHHISFNVVDVHENSDSISFHGPWVALWTILTTPELESFEKAHQIDLGREMNRLPGNVTSPMPDVTGELNDVTLSQALDYVLKTFPGYWVYENCATEGGGRTVHFAFY